MLRWRLRHLGTEVRNAFAPEPAISYISPETVAALLLERANGFRQTEEAESDQPGTHRRGRLPVGLRHRRPQRRLLRAGGDGRRAERPGELPKRDGVLRSRAVGRD